ncbi:MAG: DUF4262 domain-containing protein [Acidimicrobiales bacterium]
MSDVFPDRSMEHRDKIAWMIETEGWAIEPVPARLDMTPPQPPYAYTIGIEDSFGFPEIVVFGLKPVAARGLIGLVVDVLRQEVEMPVGELFTGLLDHDLRAVLLPIDLDRYGGLFASAAGWYGEVGFRVVQFVWPDRNGWLPWESGFDRQVLGAQPVIGAGSA